MIGIKVRIIKNNHIYYPQYRIWLIKKWIHFTEDQSYLGDREPILSRVSFYTKQEARNFLRKKGYKL